MGVKHLVKKSTHLLFPDIPHPHRIKNTLNWAH